MFLWRNFRTDEKETPMQIYVGNLPAATTDEELRKLFEKHGAVKAATVGKDKKTGEPQGYGFVEMEVKSEARAAIEALRGKKMDGKPLLVRALKPDDDFHTLATAMHGSGQQGMNFSGKSFRGNLSARAGGAIRRSGKRGS
jgi:RNA recognition motif-containing protein